MGWHRKVWLMREPPFGTPQAGCVLESMTFSMGPASTEALCGTHDGTPVPCWGVTGTGTGSGLVWALESGQKTCCMGLGTSCVFMAVPPEQGSERSIPTGCSLACPPASPPPPPQACAAPAALLLFGLGLGAQAGGVLSVGCLGRIRTVAGAAPLPH